MATGLEKLMMLQQMSNANQRIQIARQDQQMRQQEFTQNQIEWQRAQEQQAMLDQAATRAAAAQQFGGFDYTPEQLEMIAAETGINTPQGRAAALSQEGGMENLMQSYLATGAAGVQPAGQVSALMDRLTSARTSKFGYSSPSDLGTREGAYLTALFPNAANSKEEFQKALVYRSENQDEWNQGLEDYVSKLTEKGVSDIKWDPNLQQYVYFDKDSKSMKPVPNAKTRLAPAELARQTQEQKDKLANMRGLQDNIAIVQSLFSDDKVGPIQGRWRNLGVKFVDDPEYQTFKDATEQMITLAYGMSGKQISEKEIQQILGRFLPDVTQPGGNFQARLRALKRFVNKSIVNNLDAMRETTEISPTQQAWYEEAAQDMAASDVNIFRLASVQDKDGKWELNDRDARLVEQTIQREVQREEAMLAEQAAQIGL